MSSCNIGNYLIKRQSERRIIIKIMEMALRELERTEAGTEVVLWKKVFLKNLTNFTGKDLCWSLFLMKSQDPTQMFSCEICEIFNNIYFEEHLRTTASKRRADIRWRPVSVNYYSLGSFKEAMLLLCQNSFERKRMPI